MTLSSLDLYFFGPLRIEENGAAIVLRRRKAQALLAYLAVTGQPHSRDALATLLWPEFGQSQARANLRRELAELRGILGAERLVDDRVTVTLDIEAGFTLDVDEFQSYVALAEACDHLDSSANADSCTVCMSNLIEAAALYTDDFLAGFALPDSPTFDDWQFFQADGLRQTVAQLLERLVRGHCTSQQFAEAIPFARRWVALDPLHEPAHCQLMTVYDLAGQRAAALRQYEICVRALEEELGVPPAAETTALYEQIRRRVSEPGQSTINLTRQSSRRENEGPQLTPGNDMPGFAVTHTASSTPPAAARPALIGDFVGREREMFEIGQLLAKAECRLLTLVGLGGMGKTRLAIAAANASSDRYRDGFYFVPLESLESADLLASALADAVGFAFSAREDAGISARPASVSGAQTQLINYLRNKEMLLLLDSFENLLIPGDREDIGQQRNDVKAVDLLAETVRTAPGIKLLATSRMPLNLRTEWVFEVTGLAAPQIEDFTGVGLVDADPDVIQYDSIQLFMRLARRAWTSFAPTDSDLDHDELRAITRICQLVGGMPLAIELAAGWVQTLSCQEIAEEIARGIDLLETSLHDVPDRHRSLRAVFDYTWHLLTPVEQEILKKLSVFRGGFSRAAALEIAEAPLSVISVLVRKSLIHRTVTDRYGLHNLFRQYADERLAASPADKEQTQDRHCHFYASLLRRYRESLANERDEEFVEQVGEEIENVRVSWRWAVSHRRMTELELALEGLFTIYERRSLFAEGEALFRLGVEELRLFDQRTEEEWEVKSAILGKFHARWGIFHQHLGHYAQAWTLLQQGLQVARQDEDSAEIAFCLHGLATVALYQGRYADAAQAGQESLAQHRKTGNQLGTARMLHTLGRIDLLTGAYSDARQWLQQALSLAQSGGFRRTVAECLDGLGQVCWNQGDYAGAQTYYVQALEMQSQAYGENPQGKARILNGLGFVAWSQGDYINADAYHRQALHIFRQIGDRQGEANALSELGRVAERLGKFTTAQTQYEEALAINREIGDRQGEAVTLSNLGFAFFHHGSYAGARESFAACLNVCRIIGFPRYEGLALACLSLLACLQRNYPEGERLARAALSIAQEIRDPTIQGFAFTHLGYALLGQERLHEAETAYRAALELRQAVGDEGRAQEPLAGLAYVALVQGELQRARTHIEDILAYLDIGALERTLLPLHILYVCYRVLQADRDDRAQDILRTAHALLHERASAIGDIEARRTYLEEVDLHKEILNDAT